MRILAMDTSSAVGAVAIAAEGELRAELHTRVRAKHGEMLLPQVERCLELASLSFADLDLIVVGLGPGSFTGTRIALATAKGLALAKGTPLIGVGSLAALVAPLIMGNRLLLPWVDAHKGEVYAAAYRANGLGLPEALVAPFHAPPEVALATLREELAGVWERAPLAFMGSGILKYPESVASVQEREGERVTCVDARYATPRGAALIALGEARFRREGADDPAALVPAYLRPSDAKLPTTMLPSGAS